MIKQKAVKKGISPASREALRAALAEDIGKGDATTRLLVPSNVKGVAKIVAREDGIFCGAPFVREMARQTDRQLNVRFKVREGSRFRKGQELVRLRGRIVSILKLERTCLNLLSHLCGVAAVTRKFADRVRKRKVRILDTRKTTPLWREAEKYAVRTGGGSNHRMGLYDQVFIKENHRRFGRLEKLRKLKRNFVIEVRNERELLQALCLRPGVILFDNFSLPRLRRAVKTARRLDRGVLLEASGSIRLDNVLAYAKTGVDRISVGSLTHSVRSADLSLLVT